MELEILNRMVIKCSLRTCHLNKNLEEIREQGMCMSVKEFSR